MKKPLILEIKGNSLDDGPGIRSVVFFKGCPLSCIWCHNPESKLARREIGFDEDTCIACGTCMEICSEKALSGSNRFFIDRNICTLCYDCVEACPSGALSRVGVPMDIDTILAIVLKDKPFFETSGGGVTLSGGEPTLFPDFTAELLAALKQAGIHTLVETCGHFDPAVFEKSLLPYIDIIYFDIKLINPIEHARFCGISNERILYNFRLLNKIQHTGGFTVLPRTPLIPGITDTTANLSDIAQFLDDCGSKAIQLLPYHPLWQKKNRKIGFIDATGGDPALNRFLPPETLDICKQPFEKKNIMTI